MQFLPASALVLAVVTSTSSELQRSAPLLVSAVPNGTTINVAGRGRVRLLGAAAPKDDRASSAGASLGREARARLAALVLNRWVRLEEEPSARGARRQPSAYIIREDGLFVDAVLVREGLARVTDRRPLARLAELIDAEREARRSRRGMWADVPQGLGNIPRPRRHPVARASRGRYTSEAAKPAAPSVRKKLRP